MAINQKVTGRTSSMPVGLAIGGGVSLIITLLTAALLAELINREAISEESVGYGVMILLLLSSAIGSLTAVGKIKRQRMAVCLLSGGIYFCILLSITALFFGGQYDAVGVTAVLVLGGSVAAAFLSLQQGRRGRSGKTRRKHR